ncbi:hypothetical protein HLV39_03840 [Marinobacter adhaerens]|uniref:Uncharacterized protein n=1 Tax=Marinobacter adhaerens TaxID=1033846 RepID=A0A851HNN6_9GAMM|nr:MULTISPECIES: hypothetical protein [Marinobacter]NWN90633.1 hypothetical protein [Marinobacter adhaerens]
MSDSVLGENYSHKISAEFDSESAANNAVDVLVRAGIPASQTEIVRPDDPDMAIKVEPEVQGVARSLAKTHVVLGVAGLVFGLVLAALLVAVGPTLTQSSPVMTFIALGFLCPIVALLLAGAISIRPDHDPVIEKTRMANKAGRWTVVAHCASLEQQKEAKEAMGSDIQSF